MVGAIERGRLPLSTAIEPASSVLPVASPRDTSILVVGRRCTKAGLGLTLLAGGRDAVPVPRPRGFRAACALVAVAAANVAARGFAPFAGRGIPFLKQHLESLDHRLRIVSGCRGGFARREVAREPRIDRQAPQVMGKDGDV